MALHGRHRLLGTVAPDASASDRTPRFTFATSDIARDGDRIMSGAWDLANFRRNPGFLFGHDGTKPQIGKVIEIEERNAILPAPCASPIRANQIRAMYRDGTMNAVSVSWRALAFNYMRGNPAEPGARDFTKCELLEISAVPLPADPNALVASRSFESEKETRMSVVRAFPGRSPSRKGSRASASKCVRLSCRSRRKSPTGA